MIDHGHTLSLAASALDWRLEPGERRELEQHLASCRSCARAAAEMRADASRIRALPEIDAPSALRVRVLSHVERLGPQRRANTWPLVAAAVLLLGGLLGSMFVAGALRPINESSTDAPVVVPPVEASAEASLSIPADPPAPAAGARWTAFPGMFSDETQVSDLALGGRGLIAVGTTGGVSQAWSSSAGEGWTARDLPGGEFAEVFDVASGPDLIVAVGAVPSSRAAVWTSTDGSTWTRAPESPAFAGSAMHRVTVTPGGAVAIGHDRAWFSRDGRTWSVVLESAVLTDVASWKDGFVIVGCARGDELRCEEPGLWLARDGRSWSRQPLSAGQGFGRLAQVVAFGEGLVALPDHDSPAGVWRSADGVRWTQAAGASAFDRARPALLVVAGPGLVALGGPEEGGAGQIAVWTSADASEWMPVEDTTAFGDVAEVFDAVATAERLVVVGRKQIAEDGRAQITVWITPPE